MKLFLTGHRGFLGSHLIKRLQELGHEVVTDMIYFEDSYDCVIHLAAKTHISSEFDAELFNSNILFAKKIMSTPNRLIFASSCSAAYMTNPYAYTKKYNEYLGDIHGNAIGLRFHNIYGKENNKGLIKYLMEQKNKSKVTIRGPQLIRDYIGVNCVVDFIINEIIPSDVTGVVDVGTGLGWETIDVVNMYQQLSGKKFILNFIEHGNGEPGMMISNSKVKSIPLEEGLLKLINNEK